MLCLCMSYTKEQSLKWKSQEHKQKSKSQKLQMIVTLGQFFFSKNNVMPLLHPTMQTLHDSNNLSTWNILYFLALWR
jgi:hypothetical protein